MLAPTARGGRPTMRNFKETVSSQEQVEPSLGQSLRDFMEENGLEGGPFEALSGLRSKMPTNPDIWLDVLETKFGWRFRKKDVSNTVDGGRIADAVSEGNAPYPVFLVSGRHSPGDLDDRHVEKRKAEVAASHGRAVMLFNSPLVSRTVDTKELVFGGYVYDGEWHQFVLRPGGGLSDAISQRGLLKARASSGFVRSHGFEGGLATGIEIEGRLTGVDHSLHDFAGVANSDEWISFIPREMVEIIRKMARR
jgi:hypothetical protein